ncbi:MAG: hypothetical protein HOK81_01960 [Rhodospirillaceae bacterium]|jgi:hypothetical protein|nr:hypothetical protein [Rhodospirillaceae bacterium]
MGEVVSAPYREGVARALATIAREGPLAAPGMTVVEAAQGAIVVRAAVDGNHIIHAARHEGTEDPACRAVLDVLCQAIEGCPLQEAADHGAIQAMHALHVQAKARPVPGIALPRNAGPAFALAETLLRELHRRYLGERDLPVVPNEHTLPPAEEWRRLGHEARLARVKEAVVAFSTGRNLGPDDIRVVRMERDLTGEEVRVDVGFADHVVPADKPMLTRAVERWLKERLEDKLQVYMEPLKDKNAIRRL